MNAPISTAHTPPPSLAQQEVRRLALQQFERRVNELTLITGSHGPIVTGTEVELLRRKYTTVDGALAALEALAKPRLAYSREQAGAPAAKPALTDAERTAAREHFAKMRELRAEAAAAPAPKPIPADGLAAPVGEQKAEVPAPDSGYATDAIAYVDVDGFGHVLTVYAPTANEAIKRGRQAVKALRGMESKPQAAAPIATAPLNGHETTAPMCAIHKTPMQKVQGKKGSFWSCHTKLDDGSWCPYKPAD
jgi:hypothetical protein